MDIKKMSHEKVHPLLREDLIESLKLETKIEIQNIEKLILMVKNNSLTNEQWFLDFLDELNDLSVKY